MPHPLWEDITGPEAGLVDPKIHFTKSTVTLPK